jgi:hypothetical protein
MTDRLVFNLLEADGYTEIWLDHDVPGDGVRIGIAQTLVEAKAEASATLQTLLTGLRALEAAGEAPAPASRRPRRRS